MAELSRQTGTGGQQAESTPADGSAGREGEIGQGTVSDVKTSIQSPTVCSAPAASSAISARRPFPPADRRLDRESDL